MNKDDEVEKYLRDELQWVTYRQKMLDIIENKLLQMKELAIKARAENLNTRELEKIQIKINKLAIQIKALDEESRL